MSMSLPGGRRRWSGWRHWRAVSLALAMLLPLPSASAAPACPPLLDYSFPRLQDGAPQSLCQHAGKVLLVVNTASYCGFTKQYDGLERVYARYKDRGLVVLGFPSNDFGEQEPGSDKEIADFCRLTYGVKFPMLAKTEIASNPFYKQLIARSDTRPKWNFHKYLIDRRAQTVESFSTLTAPESDSLLRAIEQRLAAPAP